MPFRLRRYLQKPRNESIRAAASLAQTQQAWSATANVNSDLTTATAAANATAESFAGAATQATWFSFLWNALLGYSFKSRR